jgi:hypothetical protein
VKACDDGALYLQPADPADLVVPDPNAAKTAEQRALVQKAKAEGRAKVSKYLDALEHLGISSDDK